MGKKRANGEGSIRKRKDGRWEGFYTASYDPATGKQKIKNVLGKTQAEVKEKLKKAIADSQRLDMNRSGTHTVQSWVQMWYEVYAEPRLRENTKDYYLNYINNHIIPELGDIKLDKLTTIQIQKFYNKGLSVRVVHGIHTLLNNCLEQAVAERLILVNPARGCKLPKMEKREMKVLPEEKIRPYLMEADKRGLLAPFYLELTTGLRRHQGRTGSEPAQNPQFHPRPAGLAAGSGLAGGGTQEAPGKSLHVPVAQNGRDVRSGLLPAHPREDPQGHRCRAYPVPRSPTHLRNAVTEEWGGCEDPVQHLRTLQRGIHP